jgi:hypothetical protein
LNIEERKNEITSLVNRSSSEIINLAADRAIEKGYDPKKISKIEAGGEITEKAVFLVKIYERQRESSGEKIEFVERIRDGDSKQLWDVYIKVTF